MKRVCYILCALVLLVSMLAADTQVAVAEESTVPLDIQPVTDEPTDPNLPSYFTYKTELAKKTVAAAPEQRLTVADSLMAEDVVTYDGKEGVLLNRVGKTVSWSVTVSQPAIYEITLLYHLYGEQRADTAVGVLVDGALPYAEANQLQLESTWHNEDFTIETDEKGDHIRPTQVQVRDWHTMTLQDLYGDTVQIYLEAGEHTVSIQNEDYGLYVGEVLLTSPAEAPTYADYAKNATSDGSYFQLYEGELALYKSDSMLYPIYDRSSPVTQPYSVKNILLNTIGGGNWAAAGQWIEWEVEVPSDGWYTLGMRVRQNISRGLYSYRNITIDGEYPFAELKEYAFEYDSKWQVVELGGKDPYQVYLTAGSHTVRMQATAGPMEYIHGRLSQCLTELNTLYRKIIMITGTTPDPLRDYALDDELPGLTTSLLNLASTLRDEVARVEQTTGISGSELSALIQFADLLERMSESPDTIASRLSVFKSNISTLAQLLGSLINTPLEVGYLYVAQGEYERPRANGNFWQMLKHVIVQFIHSFTGDYSDTISTGEGEEEPLEVWIMMGRDQAQIVKNMIQDDFTPQTGLNANLSVVNLNLSQAIMAGEGPDVVIGTGESIELGVRGAILPLEEMDGFDEVISQFRPGSVNNHTYNGHTYAIPETQDFMAMFIRTDIFAELGLEIPQTWDEMRACMRKLVQENLEVGMPSGVLTTLLLQNDLSYFDDELNFVLDGGQEIAVYEEFISFYREYNCQAYYDAVNRFRTGEMPMLLASFSGANALSIQAPEIRNLWTMVPIPGTVKTQEDGTTVIDRSTDMTGTCNIITRNTANADNAWKFLKWWSSEESQTRFANELEMQMGESARYSTANLAAFNNLSWSMELKAIILEQGRWGKVLPQPPGNYILARNLNNMFVTLYNSNTNIRKTVQEYTADVNKELLRKRQEFADQS
ncbi:MAG: extracellular solute-binding protein [Clostridia bacterium]|nr:extracellular solute-binding protein [Clostridia bacterium]